MITEPIFEDGPQIMRPPLQYVWHMFGIGLAVSIISLVALDQFLAIIAICIATPILAVLCMAQLLRHFLVKVQIIKDKIVVTDYIRDYLNFLIAIKPHQEILFSDITSVYYAEKEAQLLLNLRAKMEKYDIPNKETNYTKQNLTSLYGICPEIFEKFESGSQKTLTDYTATGVLMALDEIYEKYHIPTSVRKDIKTALKNDSNFNFDILRDKLRAYPIGAQELENLKASITDTDEQVLSPFLKTKVNIGKYSRFENSSRDMMRTIPINVTLVFSNEDGTRKLYFMHFHNLSKENKRHIFEEINRKNPRVKYLMSKQALDAILRS